MPGATCPDAVRHWLRTAITVHDESRRSQGRNVRARPPSNRHPYCKERDTGDHGIFWNFLPSGDTRHFRSRYINYESCSEFSPAGCFAECSKFFTVWLFLALRAKRVLINIQLLLCRHRFRLVESPLSQARHATKRLVQRGPWEKPISHNVYLSMP